ncbi:DUF899 domain-containing protein [Pseudonocardia nematodicida]|uniref:DUF899 domain-containing protein n=1 Tax=Pseudonocardia nematodicida TaxID=1206997 RepID=A0ABV1K7A8_9PSEU
MATPLMKTLPRVVDEAEWRAARRRLLDEEKELTHRRDAVNAARRDLPMLEITTGYAFTAPDGSRRTLLDLFEGRRQLIVYHFMFDPDWDEGCPSCSYTVDNIGHLSHLHARNTTLALVSRAPVGKLAAYRERMGWDVPWYSSQGSTFNYDMHVTLDPAVAPVEYNFRDLDDLVRTEGHAWSDWAGEMPGISTYLRDDDRVFLTYVSYARGIDLVVGTNNWLDLTVLGRQENWEQPAGRADGPFMHWLRRHDQYDR